MIYLKFKTVRGNPVLPKYQTAGASGFDLAALEDETILPGQTKVIGTGLACELPRFYDLDFILELQVRPRGGTSLKTPLRVANSPGTVDFDYRGEIGIVAWNSSLTETVTIKAGERIAQGVAALVARVKIVMVEDLNETERGAGAYGHTGV